MHYGPQILLLISVNCVSTTALQCVDCEGTEDCMSGQCEGSYCMATTLRPKLMSANYGKERKIKGCIWGSLLREDIGSHCETYLEQSAVVTTCICNDKPYCNRNIRNTKKQQTKLVTCRCTGKAEGCSQQGQCIGEYCTLLRNAETLEVVSRGCINSTLPLVERRGAGACMQPPITAPTHQHQLGADGTASDDLASMESCMCSEDSCNSYPPHPRDLQQKVMECEMKMVVSHNGIRTEHGNSRKCRGEYCYNIELGSSHESTVLEYQVEGCMTFDSSAQLAEELNPDGCVNFGSKDFHLKACYKTTKGVSKLPPARKEGKFPNDTPKEIPDLPAEEQAKEQMDSPRKPEENPSVQQEPAPSQNPSNKLARTQKVSAHPPEPENPEADSQANTTIVAIFVVLMIVIVIAGIVWKFEIHKRLFRARYESVAG